MMKWRQLAVLLLLAPLAAAQAAPPPQSSKPAQPRKARQAKPSAMRGRSTPPPALTEAAPRPHTPAEMPPVAPQVSYQNGLLRIAAPNSTLADILLQVKQRTGAAVEFPAAASSERVVIDLGPAPAGDVLARLLNGSPYDYVILGSDSVPGGIQRVLLTQRQGGPPVSAPVASSPAAPGQPLYRGRPATPDEEGLDEPPEEVTEQPNEEPPPPPPAPPPSAQPGQPGVKTPEQLLEELQRMQQQQQQQQQQKSNEQ